MHILIENVNYCDEVASTPIQILAQSIINHVNINV
jgi:hypothetical protein